MPKYKIKYKLPPFVHAGSPEEALAIAQETLGAALEVELAEAVYEVRLPYSNTYGSRIDAFFWRGKAASHADAVGKAKREIDDYLLVTCLAD